MANHLDLEEQEQLDKLKHFWTSWGSLISAMLLLVLGGVAAWNFYSYWQNRQASQAAVLLEIISNSIASEEDARLKQAFSDIRIKHSGTVQAAQAGLLVAAAHHKKGDDDLAKEALIWVIENGADAAYKRIANLRIANILIDHKNYEEAFKYVSFLGDFESLMIDKKGDIEILQEKNKNAISDYLIAYQKFDANVDYRKLIDFKLNSLGVPSSSFSPATVVPVAKVTQ